MEKIKYLITKLFKLLKFIKHFLIEIYKTLLDVTGRYEFPSWNNFDRFLVKIGLQKTGSKANPASYTKSTGSLPEVKRPGRGLDHPLHLAPRLKKE